MRPLVLLALVSFLVPLAACQNGGSGPSSALEVQPAVGAGARLFAGPQDGVGGAAQVNLGKYALRTGKAAEPAPVAPPPAGHDVPPCGDGSCAVDATPPPAPVPLRAPAVDVEAKP